MPRRWPFLLLILALGLSLSWTPVSAQTGTSQPVDQEYFPETGHWLTGDFLHTYRTPSDPGKIYGYPITEVFQDQVTGRMVQYFQRARFEYIPENPPELKVRLSPLGEYLYTPGKPFPIPENFPACRSYPETGFQVCYAFLDFLEENGGAAQFGYPISNFEFHEGRIVQYFQRARLEWHPELPSGKRVVLSDLGRIYFETIRENPVRLLPAPVQNNRLQAVLSLQARAFTKIAVLPPAGVQTIFVVVQDQNLLPVTDAKVDVVLSLPNGAEEAFAVQGRTDKDGILRFNYSFKDQVPGIVRLQIEASFDGLRTRTETSFRIWW